MSSPEHHILSVIESIKHHTITAADKIDDSLHTAADSVRSILTKATWLPKSARPAPPPPPPPPPMSLLHSLVGSLGGYYGRASEWVYRHKVLAGCLVAVGCGGVVGGGYMIQQKRKWDNRKRRAKRAVNGARKEVVVIAGHPHEPTTHAIALDLERRGFIVYIVVSTTDDERLVHNESQSRSDIRPLLINVLDPVGAQLSIDRFTSYLLSPQIAFPGAHPHNLRFAGLILIPNLTSYPTGPIEVLPPDVWSDTFNVNILSTIITARSFIRTLALFKSRILILSSTIVPSLSPPFHAIEAATGNALNSISLSLARELSPLGISVCHFKLGNFDIPSINPPNNSNNSKTPATSTGPSRSPSPKPLHAARADILTWAPTMRATYAKSFLSQSIPTTGSASAYTSTTRKKTKGSPIKLLCKSIFDCLTQESPPKRVWRIGRGSWLYEVLVGGWVSEGVTGWMMGAGRFNSAAHAKVEARGAIMGAPTTGSANIPGGGGDGWKRKEENKEQNPRGEGGKEEDGGKGSGNGNGEWEKV